MAIREAINKNKTLAIVSCVVLFGAVLGIRFWAGANEIPAPLTRAYYSDDDGQTYFDDDAGKSCPFDHKGKQAVSATVFRFGNDKPFIAYLSKFSDADRDRLLQLKARLQSSDVAQSIHKIAINDLQIKKPGAGKWLSINSQVARDVMSPATPPGAGDLTSVEP